MYFIYPLGISQVSLEKSGYEHKLKFIPVITNSNKNKKKNRKRKITYFNPPFSCSVRTKVGKEFLKILDTSFPPNNPLKKIFNRNTVKLSYKCMPNMAKAISNHNQKLAKDDRAQGEEKRLCNCTRGTTCPVGGQCLRGPVVYRATVSANNTTQYYTGIAGNSFKERFNGHQTSINKNNKRNSTTLSQHVWELKDSGTNFNLSWNIVQNASSFNHSTGKCRLCNTEKLLIMFNPEGATLNSRSEFYSTCRHREKNLLKKVK